jgi:hypothetical protein
MMLVGWGRSGRPRSGAAMPGTDPTPAARPHVAAYCSGLFICCSQPANSAVILKKFHRYSIVIPLFPKTAVGPQAIEIVGRPGAVGLGFLKNSLLIPLLPQIAKRFQCDGASPRDAGPRHGTP